MKTAVILLASALISSSVWAGPKVKQAHLASDMRVMLDAMISIQRAGFYNDKEGMKTSVRRVKSGLASLRSSDASSYLPDDQAYADKFANKRANMIAMYGDDLIESVDAGDMDEALNDYVLMLKQCTSCHLRIRTPFWENKKSQ